MAPTVPARLVDRNPRVAADRLIAELVPPPRFERGAVRDLRTRSRPAEQAAALAALRDFADRMDAPAPRRRLFVRRPSAPLGPTGIYLDGGFGVGKTHLLASLWFAAPAPKSFGTFGELTNLVGALGFGATVDALCAHRLLCIDEFELDDPGRHGPGVHPADAAGRGAAYVSPPPPTRCPGHWVKAASPRRTSCARSRHWPRDSRPYGSRVRTIGIAGSPRHRSRLDDDAVTGIATAVPDATLDDFPDLLTHLASLHPSRYAALIDGVTAACLRGVAPIEDQSAALRFVALADRLYDREVPVVSSGVPFDAVFPADMLAGGYRKKYFRAVSRLSALAREGAGAAPLSRAAISATEHGHRLGSQAHRRTDRCGLFRGRGEQDLAGVGTQRAPSARLSARLHGHPDGAAVQHEPAGRPRRSPPRPGPGADRSARAYGGAGRAGRGASPGSARAGPSSARPSAASSARPSRGPAGRGRASASQPCSANSRRRPALTASASSGSRGR